MTPEEIEIVARELYDRLEDGDRAVSWCSTDKWERDKWLDAAQAAISALDQYREGKGYGEASFAVKLSEESLRMRAALDAMKPKP